MASQISKNKLLENFIKRKLIKQECLRKNSEFFDLYLIGNDGLEIGVHKVIISSASDYFNDLLTMGTKEKNEKYIRLPGGITSDILEKIITFIYTNEFDEDITNAEIIIKYAVLYQLHELEQICTLILAENLNEQNFLKYWRHATENLSHKLEDKCVEFIESRFEHLYNKSLLNNLTFREMISLLSSNKLQLSEEYIFDFAWNWCQKHTVDEEISQIINLVRFSQLNNEMIISKILYNKTILKFVQIEKLMELLASRLQSKNTKPSCLPFTTSNAPRIGSRRRKLLGLTTNAFFQNIDGDVIRQEKQLLKGYSFTNFGINYLLACGGGNNSSCCEYFEPINMKWNNFPAMKTGRTGHACFYLDNCIYSCGGRGLNSIEIFDLGIGKWHMGPIMHERRENFSLNVNNGALYAFGGGYKNIEVYDPRTPGWKSLTQNDFPIFGQTRSISREFYIYCVHNGKLYIFDTRTEKFTNEIINLQCEQNENTNFGLCSLDDKYFYISKRKLNNGSTFSFTFNSVEPVSSLNGPFFGMANSVQPKKQISNSNNISINLAKYDFKGNKCSENVVHSCNTDVSLHKENLEALELVALYY